MKGFEPSTSCLGSKRSSQLSYTRTVSKCIPILIENKEARLSRRVYRQTVIALIPELTLLKAQVPKTPLP